jgi:zinc-ribbon domain
MSRVCANCGTEVDDEALFCPTCGQPIQADAQPELPPAPEWPESAGSQERAAADVGRADTSPPPAPPAAGDEAGKVSADTGTWDQPGAAEAPAPAQSDAGQADEYVPPWRRDRTAEPYGSQSGYPADTGVPPPAAAPVSAAPPRPGTSQAPQQVLDMPTTLSGWLVGIGALVAILVMFLPWISFGSYTAAWGFASGINILFAIVLLAVVAGVFVAHLLPEIPRRDLVFASIGLLGVGIGLDRIGIGAAGIGAILFLLASLALAGGGFVSLLGYDRPMGEATR